MLVRAATVHDAPAIGRIHVGGWQQAYAHLLPAEFLAAIDPDRRTGIWRREIAERTTPTEIFVADAGDGLAGFVEVGAYRPEPPDPPEPAAGEVFAIYVDPGRWSAGVGRALMDAAVAHLAGAGFAEIRLWVFAENLPARRFYEKFGFAPDGQARTDTVGTVGTVGVYPTEVAEVRYSLPVR